MNVPDNGTTWQLAVYAGMNVFTYDVYYNPVVGGSYYVATDQAFQYDGIVHFVEEQIS